MAEKRAAHVFGPVPSRRLGFSLGIDVSPMKTCSYDCIYCQLGRTDARRARAGDFVAPQTVIAEVARKLAGGARPDYLTLSGSGEPTLYSRLGELLAGLRRFRIPLAVITNGSLLWRPRVAAACARADLVAPTLTAGSAAAWKRVNRPHRSIAFRRMVEGLVRFRGRFRGRLWLEVMLVAGVNDSAAQVRAIARLAARIRPDGVWLGTVTRPPAEHSARPVPRRRLERLAGLFAPRALVLAEAPGQIRQTGRTGQTAGPAEVLAMIRRHPATAAEVAAGLGLARGEARRHLARLAAEGLAAASRSRAGRKYWRARPASG